MESRTVRPPNNAAYGYDVRGELVGERASVTLGTPVWSRTHANFGATETYAADWRPRFADAYRLQNHAFIRFVETGQPSAVAANAWDGMLSTLIADKGCEALASGATVSIETPDAPELYKTA